MKRQLLELEERILSLLSAAQGNILDDQELVETLAQSKVGWQRARHVDGCLQQCCSFSSTGCLR
jgi:hypothetical protein